MSAGRPRRRPNRRAAALFAVVLLGLLAALAVGPPPAAAEATVNVTAYRTDDAGFGSADAVEAAIANGTLEPADELVVGDTLVAVIDSDRLAATMVAGDGSTTERFFTALDGGAAFRIVQTNPTPQLNRKAAVLGPENVTVYRDGPTAYVLVETANLTFRYRKVSRPAQLGEGERYVVQFGYNLTDVYDARDDPGSPVVGLHPFRSEFLTSGRWYEPLPPAWVELAVDVEVAPAESIAARARLDGNRTVTAAVKPEDVPGVARVWLDLRSVQPGTDYVLELVHDGEVTDRYAGTVREPRAVVTDTTLTEVETSLVVTRDGERVTTRIDNHTAVRATVRLSHGGKVQVLDAACEQVGFEWVEPGNATRVTIELWNGGEPVLGVDQSAYGVYLQTLRHRGASDPTYDGDRATAAINVDGECPSPASRSTPKPVVSATPGGTPASPTSMTPATPGKAGPAETGAEGDEAVTTTPGQPGFTGPALVAALLIISLLGSRRS